MPKDSDIDDLDKEIQKIREEQARISEYLAELEAKSKTKVAELEALERKKREEEKKKLEVDMKETFSELLLYNWQLIPTFLNESFEYLENAAVEYDRLKLEETNLRDKMNTLLKNPALKQRDIGRLQEEIRSSIGGRIELILELKRLLRSINSSDESWTQKSDSILRFLDVSREVTS